MIDTLFKPILISEEPPFIIFNSHELQLVDKYSMR